MICDSDTITFTVNNVPGDTIAWYVNDNPVGVAKNWTPAAGVLNDGDSVTAGAQLLEDTYQIRL